LQKAKSLSLQYNIPHMLIPPLAIVFPRIPIAIRIETAEQAKNKKPSNAPEVSGQVIRSLPLEGKQSTIQLKTISNIR